MPPFLHAGLGGDVGRHRAGLADSQIARGIRTSATQKSVTQSGAVRAPSKPHHESETAAPLAIAGNAAVCAGCQLPPRGVEGQQFGTKKNTEEQYGDSRSDSTGLIEPSAILSKPLISEREPPDWVWKQIAALPPEVIAALWVIFRSQTHGSPSDRSR